MLCKEVTDHIDKLNETSPSMVYAPLFDFEFQRNFTDDKYFMAKLCHICDKANAPHHVVDDVVDLLKDCKINNMQLQPEKLMKRQTFLSIWRSISTVPFHNQSLLV